jgi:hypothetical protein
MFLVTVHIFTIALHLVTNTSHCNHPANNLCHYFCSHLLIHHGNLLKFTGHDILDQHRNSTCMFSLSALTPVSSFLNSSVSSKCMTRPTKITPSFLVPNKVAMCHLWIGYHSKCSALIICVSIFKIYLTECMQGQLVIERSLAVLNGRGMCVINSNITIQ